jgi:hypothetical protein
VLGRSLLNIVASTVFVFFAPNRVLPFAPGEVIAFAIRRVSEDATMFLIQG